MKKIKYTILSFLLLIHTISWADDATDQFNAANQAYQDGNYNQAIEIYEGLTAQDYNNAAVFYNLGNAYFKTNQVGKAILNYERALHRQPRHKDAQHNLAIAEEKMIDDIVVLPPFFLKKWWIGMRDSGSSGFWGLLTILFLIAGLGGISVWLLGKTRQYKKYGFIGGSVGLILAFLLLGLGLDRLSQEKDSSHAIIFERMIPLRVSPDELSSDLIELHEGTKVEILDKIGDWYKVQLSNGEEGWLPTESVEKI